METKDGCNLAPCGDFDQINRTVALHPKQLTEGKKMGKKQLLVVAILATSLVLWSIGAAIASGPVLSYADVLSDSHFQERAFFETVTRTVTGTNPQHGFPVKFSETPTYIRKPAPILGEDNEYIFKKYLGMTDDDIKQLEEEEIIGYKPQGWALSMDAEEAISKIRDIHEKGDTK